jgi:glucokinase
MIAIGIDLGGTNIKAALVDRDKGLLKQLSIPTEAELGRDHTMARIAEAVTLIAAQSDEKPVGVGVGSPGAMSMDRRWVSYPPNLKGWKDEPLSEEVHNRTGFHCLVENDANVAALGSSRFGIGKQFDSFILLTLGTGVGGGIIIDRNLYRGTTGAAAELGHVIIDYHGPISNSVTRGGLEAYIGQRFLSRYAADVILQYVDNPLYEQFNQRWDDLEPKDLSMAAEAGNSVAIQILQSAGEKLGYAIVNYIHILDIRKIIVSGGVAKAGHWILEPAYKTALSRLMPPFHKDFEILYEPMGNDAALLGAASMAFEFLA